MEVIFQAEPVTDCLAKIDELRGQTVNATFFGQNADKNETGLLTKLDNATVKLAEDKTLMPSKISRTSGTRLPR